MKLLFHAKEEESKAAEARAEARKRAADFDKVMQDFEETEKESRELASQLSGQSVVQAVRYRKYKRPGSKWMIEHGRVGDDYIFQVFPSKPTVAPWQDIIAWMIVALDAIFPPTIDVTLKPPDPTLKLPFYTIRMTNVTKVPGWQEACEIRANRALSDINAWGTKG